jgi:hypothetical protein
MHIPVAVSLNVSENGLAAMARMDILNRDVLVSVLTDLA